jgi:Na+-driven multidrug efflux pump
VNVVLDAVLIPRFGLLGCAWATAAAYGTGTVVAVVLTRKLASVRIRWYLLPALPPLVSAVLASGGDPFTATAAGLVALLVLGLSARSSVEKGFLRLTRLALSGPAGSNG